MNATDIVAYAYKAELYTPLGVVHELMKERRLSPAALNMDPDEVLEQLAEAEALDEIERSDSATFPQPVFADQIGDDDTVLNYYGNTELGSTLVRYALYGEL